MVAAAAVAAAQTESTTHYFWEATLSHTRGMQAHSLLKVNRYAALLRLCHCKPCRVLHKCAGKSHVKKALSPVHRGGGAARLSRSSPRI